MAEDEFDYAAERVGDFEVEQASITCMSVGNATPTPETHQSISLIQGKGSPIWQNFEINGEHAACKFCKRLIHKHSGTTGTSNLKRYLDRCQQYKDSDKSNESNASEFDQKEYCKLFARAILKHGYSLSIVEHEGFRELHTYLNSKVRTISRNTILKWCMTEHDVLKQYVRNMFKALSSKVSLTCDVWIACTTRGYFSLMAHFVDNDWKLRSKVLNFRHFPPPHNGHENYNLVFSLIKDWGTERKICSMTIDNASLKVIDESVAKVRENVKYVDSSEARLIRFEGCVSSCNFATGVKLWMDVPTRWNSTFLMLRRALDLLSALKMFGRIESNYHLVLTAHEWEIVEKMCDFLEPFYDITNLFSGSEYPTSNLYVANVCRIESLLVAASKGDDPKLKEMADLMCCKFDKYWSDYSVLLSFAAILDPRFKLKFLRHLFKDLYEAHMVETKSRSGDMGKSELELYLELPLKPCIVDEEFDVDVTHPHLLTGLKPQINQALLPA
ncbi:zinc finger BED domain-containing protein RICESLEEPER 2-like [Chenopodium quinoa]|uniref:zinc finger BED domain-containing protein RICESLEEPER 2-like n=1 Tax=Chenopodium quinoa TaxID=63459 RepID=UPI000B76CF99|nr:zinc finger BED domain-containing protein RICESLEEPER 2-like [Chenopodium quinoa]